MKKRVLGITLALCMVIGMAAPAAAASFNLEIKPPFADCMVSTGFVTKATGTTPYVAPNISQTPTNYFLSPQTHSSNNATNIITNISTVGQRNFTYNSGYGGAGQSYCLSMYPTNTAFAKYTTSGTWST